MPARRHLRRPLGHADQLAPRRRRDRVRRRRFRRAHPRDRRALRRDGPAHRRETAGRRRDRGRRSARSTARWCAAAAARPLGAGRRQHDLHERHDGPTEGGPARPSREPRSRVRGLGALRPLDRSRRLGTAPDHRADVPRGAPHVRRLRPRVRGADRRDAALGRPRGARDPDAARDRPRAFRADDVRPAAATAGSRARGVPGPVALGRPARCSADLGRGEAAHDRLVGADPRRVLGRNGGRREYADRLGGMARASGLGRTRPAGLRGLRGRRGRPPPAGGRGRGSLLPQPGHRRSPSPTTETRRRPRAPISSPASTRSATSARSTRTATSGWPIAAPT